jgi:hypothetical protein
VGVWKQVQDTQLVTAQTEQPICTYLGGSVATLQGKMDNENHVNKAALRVPCTQRIEHGMH